MKLKAYPRYKSSGVEWLGDVPEFWEVKRLKDLLKAKKNAIKTGPFGSQLLSSEMYDEDVKVYNQKSVISNDFEYGENYISLEKFKELKEFQTFPGDFLITTRGTIGRCAILPENAEQGVLHPCLMRLQTDKAKVYDRFLEILIEESTFILEQLRIKSNGTTIEVIYQDSLKNVTVLLPPLSEQQSIADYLDRETGKIDELISKKELLIERLKEKRTALISRAVTKGLNPNVRFKPSGVEWLGDVPEHWDVKRLKYLIAEPITDGPHTTPEFIDDGIPFLSVDGIQDGELVFEKCRYISLEDHKEFKQKAFPRVGDILLGKAASTGKIARVKVDFEFSIWSPLALIRPDDREVDSAYLEYSFKSMFLQAQIDIYCTSNTQKNISMDDIPILIFGIPAIAEQKTIVEYLDRETGKIDALAEKVHKAIQRLKEYRTALISAAVTGKIYVR